MEYTPIAGSMVHAKYLDATSSKAPVDSAYDADVDKDRTGRLPTQETDTDTARDCFHKSMIRLMPDDWRMSHPVLPLSIKYNKMMTWKPQLMP